MVALSALLLGEIPHSLINRPVAFRSDKELSDARIYAWRIGMEIIILSEPDGLAIAVARNA